jgi:hypothetical protein
MAHSGVPSTSWYCIVTFVTVSFVVEKSEILKETLSPSRDVISITPSSSGKWKPLPVVLTSSGSNGSKQLFGDKLGDSLGVALEGSFGFELGDELGLLLDDERGEELVEELGLELGVFA